jgi:hypothetical protein
MNLKRKSSLSIHDARIAGLYDLEHTIGRGHFAVVKLARHVFTGEKVRENNSNSCVIGGVQCISKYFYIVSNQILCYFNIYLNKLRRTECILGCGESDRQDKTR